MDDEFDEELDDEEGNYQDYESEVLAWENYTQFEDIATDGNLTCIVLQKCSCYCFYGCSIF